MTQAPQSQRPRRRWLRWIAVTFAFLTLGLALALVAARLYFNDERLRRIITEQATTALGVPVRLSELHLDLGSELTIAGLVVGPPPGFTRDILTVGRLHLAWRLRPLFAKAIVIPDLTVSDVAFCLEQNEHGQNIDVVATPGEAPPQSAGPVKLEQPDIPLRVELTHVAFEHVRAEVVSAAMTASIDEVGVTASASAEHRAMTLDVWAGLGSRDDASATSHLRFAQPGTLVEGAQRLGITLGTTGFGDVRLGLDVVATTTVREPYALPALKSSATAHATIDLVKQETALKDTHVTIGEKSHLDLGVHATRLLETPSVAFDELKGVVDLGALAPFIAVFVPGDYRGTIDFAFAPTALTGAVPDVTTLATKLTVKANDVAVNAMSYDARGIDAALNASLANGMLTADLDASALGLTAPQGSITDVHAATQLTTAVAPFLTTTADGNVDLTLRARVGHAGAAVGTATGMVLELQTAGPAALLLGREVQQPLVTHAHLTLDKAAAQGNTVRGVDVTADVAQDDVAANSVRLGLAAAVVGTKATLPQGTITLPKATLGVKLTRHLATVDVKALDFALGDLTAMHAKAHVERALGASPRVKGGELTLADTRLERLVALLPPALRPPMSFTGTVSGRVAVDGTIPYVELTAAAQAPYVPRFGDVWGETIAAYDKFAQSWATRFDRGMPFSADVTLAVSDLVYDTEELALQDGKLTATTQLGAHGPELHAIFEAGTLATNVTMTAARFELDAKLAGAHATTRMHGVIQKLDSEALPTPLTNTTLDFAASYDLDGDASTSFAATVPSLGARLAAHAKLRSPLDVATARSWEQPRLPGVAADIGWDAEMHNDTHLSLGGGVAMIGNLSSHGSLQIDRGVAAFTGAFTTNKLSVKANDNEIDEITGTLPIDVRVAFEERDDATPLARELAFAGGTVSLLTKLNAKGARPIYYPSMRHYRHGRGLTIRRVKSGPYVIEDIAFDGGLSEGRLAADWLSLHVLGGDVVGNMALRISSDRALYAMMDLKLSNIDASTFSQLRLTPGLDSELDANMHVTFKVAPRLRELNFDMNVTHIGSKTLDRFLQLLDPDGENASLQRTRGQLGFVHIENLAAWIRYENLNMDINVLPFVRVPFTRVGFPNIDRQLLRRYSISEQLDYYLQPTIDTTLAPLLGWNRAN